jgi:hypothetical protein
MGGGSTPATSTTTVNNPGQQELYQTAMPFLRQFAANPPSLPSGGTVAGFDPSQVAGQEGVLSAAAGPQTDLASEGAATSGFLSGDVLHPGSNPALQETINAATLPIEQQLTSSTLPAIRSGAQGAGQFGSSRQGIAEGLASRGASQAIGATSAGIANQGYQSGLDAMVKNLGLLPQTIQAQLAPSLATSGVGDVRQQMAQQLLSEKNLYEQYPQLLPLLMGQSIAGIGSGMQPSGTTTVGTSSQPNSLMQGLGLGISGLGALGSFGAGVGSAGAGGASGLMALLPFLGSDRRMKRDIVQIGQLKNGVPVFRFKYKTGTIEHVGFMADSVPACCVVDVLGYSVVNYQRVLELAGA